MPFTRVFRPPCLRARSRCPVCGRVPTYSLGGLAFDNSAPIEVSADALSVDPEDGSAVFEGNVVVAPGRTAPSPRSFIRVEYATDEEGNRTPPSAAFSADRRGHLRQRAGCRRSRARRSIPWQTRRWCCSGDVLLTQGQNVVAGDVLQVDLERGTGRIEGGVRTVFQTGRKLMSPRDLAAEGPPGETGLKVRHLRKAYRKKEGHRGREPRASARRGGRASGPQRQRQDDMLLFPIAGLVNADGGQITIDGRDITRLPMHRRARMGIGYLPQEASIFRGLNAEDNIRAISRDRLSRPRGPGRQARGAPEGIFHRAHPPVAVGGAFGR